MQNKLFPNLKRWLLIAQFIALLLAGILFFRWWQRRSGVKRRVSAPETSEIPPATRLEGLSESEAAARLQDIDLEKLERVEARRFFLEALRKNLFTIFNIDLFSIGVLMYVLGSPTAALGSLIVLLIALVLNVFQEVYTKSKLDRIVRSIRPQAAVIREGHIKSVDPLMIVQGDLLILRPGDHVLVNGEIVAEGSITVEQTSGMGGRQVTRTIGDELQTDEFCVSGHTVYRSLEAGNRAQPEVPGSRVQLLRDEKTPLQRLINNLFLALFVLVLIFSALLVLDAIVTQSEIVSVQYRDGFSIIFGIAPTSLFLVLVVQYAVGTFRVAEVGALVYKSESIESLANVSVVCFSLTSLTGGLQVKMEPIAKASGRVPISENLVRQILGDVLHSSPVSSREIRQLADTFPGTTYDSREVAPFLSANGWYGVSFDEPNLRGTYVIGSPEELEPYLAKGETSPGDDALRLVDRTRLRMRRLFDQQMTGSHENANENRTSKRSDLMPEKSRRQRLVGWLQKLLDPIEVIAETETSEEEWEGLVELLFAYLPEPVSLYDQRGWPRIPFSLNPLANLYVSDSVRPEIRDVMQELLSQGIQVKILSNDHPARANAALRKLGIEHDQITQLNRANLEQLGGEEYSRRVRETMIFGEMTPSQKSAVVQSLRDQGEHVAMIGQDISDVLAMRQADLRLALRSGTQAAVMLTDIVILEDSMKAIPSILAMGQRLVSGVLDTFKLYLSQVGLQLMLLLYMLFFSLDQFPVHPTQAGVISAFTIAAPNILLALWSAGGRHTQEKMRRQLAHFIIPSAITLSLLAWGVYALFGNRTSGPGFPPHELIRQLKLTGVQPFYAELAVTYALLIAGWLRVFFLQPPAQFWVGGAPLRGDRRVYGLVLASVGLFVFVLVFPFLPLQEWLRITWLPTLRDYLLVAGAAFIWAFVLRAIWRLSLRYMNGSLFNQS